MLETKVNNQQSFGRAVCAVMLAWLLGSLGAAQSSVAPDVTLEDQGQSLLQQGQYQAALAAFWKAVDLRTTRMGADTPNTLQLYEEIGLANEDLRQYPEALIAYTWAQAGLSRTAGSASPDAIRLLTKVGNVWGELGERKQGEAVLQQALDLVDLLSSDGRSEAAFIRLEQGRLAARFGDDVSAQPLLELSLLLYQQTFAPGSPQLAPIYEDLGNLELRHRHFEEALPNYLAALSGYLTLYGPDHPSAARQYANLAQVYREKKQADFALALDYDQKYIQTFFKVQQGAFQTLDNAGKVHFNDQARTAFEHYFEGVFFQREVDEVGSRQLIEDALSSWLTYKGSAYALENGLSALLNQSDSALRNQVETYLSMRQDLAAISTVQPLTVPQANANAARIYDLRGRISDLETQLSGQLGRFQDILLPGVIGVGDLKSVLRPGEVYLDYVWSDISLFVYAYRWDGRLDVQWLPAAGYLRAQFEALRKGAEGGASLETLRPQTQFLYDQLLQPLEATLAGSNALVISPDGPLNFLPFELLSDGKRALLERFVIRYTPSARDLIRLRRSSAHSTLSAPAVFGNPAFSVSAAPASTATRGSGPNPTVAPAPANMVTLPTLASLLRGTRTRFAALPGSESEARQVSNLLGAGTRTYLGAEATSANLFALHSPSVLHLATHGFFLSSPQQREQLPNPLLRVGLALTGAQKAMTGSSAEGLLSGLELAGLSLDGTELVVLSACETALGDAVAGEGVAGLNQAFLTAGARRVILSQWQVLDAETGTLMADFYARYVQGTEAAEALRQSKLDLMERGLPPRDWAAFLLSGV
ncbi:CHAT domain-containing protein [Deinococcus irradiatisoli]|nr:CHAT domain-containing tetratricopeptide repeat protein [Deinococcus irradiatisoli]